ncbi:uncharacterized protein FSUBG_3789 [Fusarium subglutinans]|uniref:Uncharacterized protein n=1 Tax=Gibberella subglutinans TaxID=42677 RepID=A0A8H5Q6Y1_GIBSU|nr:uncharacterized protein FSUBG_3789 [Fusarium subglutinans]KAF5609792.1 hypothetical protein FSUBG_3789 [Fusarium subglutinans]
MAFNSAKNAAGRKEHSTPNKAAPEAAEHSSIDVNENKTDMIIKSNKNDKTAGEKKDRRKVWGEHYDKLASTTPEKFLAKDPHLKEVPTAMRLPSKAREYIAKVEADDLANLENSYDDGKLSEHDLLELGAREVYM